MGSSVHVTNNVGQDSEDQRISIYYNRSIGMTDADDDRSSISTKLACESPTFDSAMKTDGKYVMGLRANSDLNREVTVLQGANLHGGIQFGTEPE